MSMRGLARYGSKRFLQPWQPGFGRSAGDEGRVHLRVFGQVIEVCLRGWEPEDVEIVVTHGQHEEQLGWVTLAVLFPRAQEEAHEPDLLRRAPAHEEETWAKFPVRVHLQNGHLDGLPSFKGDAAPVMPPRPPEVLRLLLEADHVRQRLIGRRLVGDLAHFIQQRQQCRTGELARVPGALFGGGQALEGRDPRGCPPGVDFKDGAVQPLGDVGTLHGKFPLGGARADIPVGHLTVQGAQCLVDEGSTLRACMPSEVLFL
jgi:hypothetical protein